MNRNKGAKASQRKQKTRALKLYLVVYLTAVITFFAPQTPTSSPALTRTMVIQQLEPKEYAYQTALLRYGWGKQQHKCLGALWGKESAWNFKASSPTKDYGIPQRHMRLNTQKEINDFLRSPHKQIDWGLKYISIRYKTPCKAWSFWLEKRWY